MVADALAEGLAEAARLIACPQCGATNAASRMMCGRCGRRLDAPAPEADAGEEPRPVPHSPGRFRLLVAALALIAGSVVVGVVLAFAAARGLGPFTGVVPAPAVTGPAALETAAASASSAAPAAGDVTYDAANVLDGDPTTAWHEGERGSGIDEWVEVELAAERPVSRVLVWNGYQRQGRFADHARVARMEISVAERVFTVDLRDLQGPQAVDLPEPVTADRVRLTILDVYPGDRYEDTAISEIEIFGPRTEGG